MWEIRLSHAWAHLPIWLAVDAFSFLAGWADILVERLPQPGHFLFGAKPLGLGCAARLFSLLTRPFPVKPHNPPQTLEQRTVQEIIVIAETLDYLLVNKLEAAGDVLMQQDEQETFLLCVVDGTLEVTRDTVPLAVAGTGEILGEMALFGESVRSATVRASTPATLLRLHEGERVAVTSLIMKFKQSEKN